MKFIYSIFFIMFGLSNIFCQKNQMNDIILKRVDELVGSHMNIYTDLHQHPELSLMEVNTARKMADNLHNLGFETTTGFGGNGVVGILRNGKGKTIMLRTDMDALPVKEMTGLPFSSNVIMKDINGNENPVMHACGHDMHMTVFLGTLSVLASLKDLWKGTLIAVAQPAEEGMSGAALMLGEGLYKKFPLPDFAFCYHVSAELPAGTIGYLPGPIFAGVRSAEITVYGKGGHGAMPHRTIDPVVIASRIILDIQTIVSREINPVKPAVVTVGSIHGGTRANVIPDEVKMLLTIRFFEEEVFQTIKESLINICKGAAISAGLSGDRMPLVTFSNDADKPVVNNYDLVMTGVKSMKSILGDSNIILVDPATVAEDFGKYGQSEEHVPIALFWLGGVNREKYNEYESKGTPLPPLHSSTFAPDFEPAFKAGVSAMSRSIIDIMGKKQ
jgi:hippurate hydrolase